MNLTRRFVLILLVVGLVPLLILATLSLRATAKIELESSNKLESGAKNTLEMIERNLFERYGDVQAFGTNHVLFVDDMETNSLSKQRLTETINGYVRLYGLYSLSMVTDTTGKVIAVNSADAAGKPIDTAFLIGKDFSKASWFQDARDGKFMKSDLLNGTVVEDVTQDPDVVRVYGKDCLTVGFSAPITTPKGDFIGVWHNFADFGLIVEAIIQSNWQSFDDAGYHTTEYYLLDKTGVLLAHYHPSDFSDKAIHHDFSELLKRNFTDVLPSAKAAIQPNASGNGRERDIESDHWNLSGYAKSQGALGYPGLGWALVMQCEEREMNQAAFTAERAIYVTVGVSALLLIIVAILVARSITQPIQACVSAMDRLAQGDLTAQVGLKRSDELGTLAKAINSCIGNLRNLVGSLTQSASDLQRSAHTLTNTAHTQAAAAEETTVQASTVAAAGEELSINAKSMSASSAQITQSTTTVASAMEEMSSSIQKVARSCAEENEIARKADSKARETRELMSKLDDSSRQIGKVVELINRIAEQTNLLALNATIEAASAGEAGRGFAVVANEVKELARQSASATEDIRKQVGLIQDNTGASMKSLDEVAKIIEQVSRISSTVAAAVEEQSATTSEIVGTIHSVSTATGTLALNVQQTAEGAAEVARNISGVSTAAADGARGATLVSTSATELTALSATLSELVSKFKI